MDEGQKGDIRYFIDLRNRRYLWQLENAVIDCMDGVQNQAWRYAYEQLAFAVNTVDAFMARSTMPVVSEEMKEELIRRAKEQLSRELQESKPD